MILKKHSILYAYLISIILITIYFVINFNQFHITIHDGLDQAGWLQVLKDNNSFFSKNNAIIPFMNGIERGFLPPETQVANLIYLFLEPKIYHIFLFIIKFSVAFFSFIILAKYLLKNFEQVKLLTILFSISFALSPGYENLYIAQASLPLITFLYLKFINERSFLLIVLILIYPIFSDLARFGIFILFFMALHFLYLVYKRDKRFVLSFLSILILSIGYIVVEYRIILSAVNSIYETNRSSMVVIANGSFLVEYVRSFLLGQYHFSSYSFFFLLIIFYSTYIKLKFKVKIDGFTYFCFLLIIFNSFLYASYTTTDFKYIFWEYVTPLSGWNYYRSLWFNSFLWHISSLLLIGKIYVYSKKNIIIFIALMQILFTLINPVYGNNFIRTIKCNYISSCDSNLSYDEFFSVNLFSKIKSEINYNKNQKVIAFGFHPSVLTYNGFYSADGYSQAYYLKDKLKFRELIKPGLDKYPKYQDYFDNWGGRAYIFSEEVSYEPSKQKNYINVDLPIDFNIAKKMRIKYVMSNNPLIINENLKFVGSFTNDKSPYLIRVYEII